MSTSIRTISKLLSKDLESSRYDHILRVCDTALMIKQKFNFDIDEDKIIYASLLHDSAKGLEEYYFDMYKDEYRLNKKEIFDVEAIAHAKLAPIVSEERFDIDDKEILHAVRWHTTACENMPLLTKIIFLADFIEPGRKFEDAQKVRDELDKGLDKAVLLCLNLQIKHLEESNIEIDKTIYSARDFLEREIND